MDLSDISSLRTLKYKNGLCPREMLVKLSTYLDMSLSGHLRDTGVGSHFKTSLLLSYFSDQVECLMWSHCLSPATSTTFPSLWEYTSFDNICTTSNASLYSITKSLACLLVICFQLMPWKMLNTFFRSLYFRKDTLERNHFSNLI